MLCSCGRPVLLAESDADKKAIDDLKRQVKGQDRVTAELTKARIEQLQAEVDAEKAYKAAIRRANASMIQSMTNHATMRAILGYTDEQLLRFVLDNGYGLAVSEFIDQADKIRDSVKRAFEVTAEDFSFSRIDLQVDTLQTITTSAVFDDVVIPTVKGNIKEALRDLALDIPPQTIRSNLAQKLESASGRQLTEIRTKISQYGRAINSVAAKAAGLDHYLYTGPIDGITRGFCRELVNLVVNDKQMSRLNNGQGLSVITSGGGYNCRHSWSPVSEGFIKAAKLKKATSADINQANARAE